MVRTFFYGGLSNHRVMANLGISRRAHAVAILPGYDIDFAPHVNLREHFGRSVFGIVMDFQHSELKDIYSRLDSEYDPFPVLVQLQGGAQLSALTYISLTMPPGLPDRAQVETLTEAGQDLGYPDEYLMRLRSFLRHPEGSVLR
jgi:hypothetical protein